MPRGSRASILERFRCPENRQKTWDFRFFIASRGLHPLWCEPGGAHILFLVPRESPGSFKDAWDVCRSKRLFRFLSPPPGSHPSRCDPGGVSSTRRGVQECLIALEFRTHEDILAPLSQRTIWEGLYESSRAVNNG